MSGSYEDFLGNSYDYSSQTFNAEKAKQEAEEKKEKFNIILFGATGVGKSSLVNAVFGEEIVKSGVGKPVTQHLEKITVPKKGLVLWDTKGIESKDYEGTINQLKKEIKSSFDSYSHFDDVPHLGWMCIDASGARVEQRDIELIGILKEYEIPIVIVFTKTLEEDTDEFVHEAINEIDKHHGSYVADNYVRVNSKDRKIGKFIVPVSGLDDLVDMSFKRLPDAKRGAKQALKKAQMVKMGERLEAMKNGARNIVHGASAAAGAVGASPIPGSDAPLIAAVQSGMIYKINSEFELDTSTSTTTSVVTGILGVTAVAQVGKAVVSNALKFIPGVGSLLGGVISAATAAALTQAVGQAYIQVLVSYYNKETGIVELPESATSILSVFKEHFSFKK
ncbi:50S ribosome-binding GTPase [Pectobacterium brasiliense]|uniref:GTPase n=1 Tax=Pectobacterium brasiliense TaxID=180957 RepID=UPI0015DDA075|nr:GTPase [Pectobacterium brasiliense]MBA0195489.1 50S ribosome-binding GTPase [Pectobacterium brasiliense]MBN3092292.1 50S ribosome-binding GTPase [Pectobacterium brasiliense]MBN3133866.1 50S ribosome-binding GTPase [Pectobacterium brasiliense]MBN3142060.1 50S ribosome-binding GTPase [Pectobacterium brasiliense]MBW5895783.1 50S ribosome-binding GTPase [Pectobacterium brasiliense]